MSFPEELSRLSLKLEQAEAWVERVRSAVPQKQTRKHADADKAEFGAIKSLLEEGGGLRAAGTREFEHMATLVETAEEWMGRVREAMGSGEAHTVRALEALLGEADAIPVNMDEHQVRARSACGGGGSEHCLAGVRARG